MIRSPCQVTSQRTPFLFTTVSYLLVHLRCVLRLCLISVLNWDSRCVLNQTLSSKPSEDLFSVHPHGLRVLQHFKEEIVLVSLQADLEPAVTGFLQESFIFPFASESTNKYLLNFIILLTFKFRLVSNYWLALKDGN